MQLACHECGRPLCAVFDWSESSRPKGWKCGNGSCNEGKKGTLYRMAVVELEPVDKPVDG